MNCALEVCKQYNLGSLMLNSFYCVEYCCGTCNFRYCCSNESLSIDQAKCRNTFASANASNASLSFVSKSTLLSAELLYAQHSSSTSRKLFIALFPLYKCKCIHIYFKNFSFSKCLQNFTCEGTMKYFDNSVFLVW